MKTLLIRSAILLLACAPAVHLLAQATAPTFTPPAGSFTSPITLELTESTTASIYYTTDGSTPTAGSTPVTGPIPIGAGTTTVKALAVIDGVNSNVVSATYTIAPETSSTTLKLSASPLVLPGALTLTATVNPAASSGAMPTGNINFQSNGSTSLGTAPLKILPATQAFTREVVLPANPLSNPAGLASVVLSKGAQPALVSALAGLYYTYTVVLYQLSPSGDSFNTYSYINNSSSSYPTDSVVGGYFLQPASSGVQSFVVHKEFEYDTYDGSVDSTAPFTLNAPRQISNNAGCDCTYDTETLSVADFDNDGYSDLGVLLASNQGGQVLAGIALNKGSSQPGTFNNFIQAPTPSSVPIGDLFCAVAIATGHFTSTPGAQLAVLGFTSVTNCSTSLGPSSIYLYTYQGGALVPTGTPLALPDNNASTLAAADLNGDGIDDLIIGNAIVGSSSTTGGINTALGVGDGSFKPLSAFMATPTAPLGFTFNDFNADGHLDLAYNSFTGYSVLYGDGAGNFSKETDFTYNPAPTVQCSCIASADFNGDGLPDIASLPDSSPPVGSPIFTLRARPAAAPSLTAGPHVDIALNSASAQAVLPLSGTALAAGTYSLTAAFPADTNFATSTSTAASETVNQTVPVITWTGAGSTLSYGTPLGPTELNAAANVPGAFTYTPGLGSVLPLGNNILTAAFAPTDSFDYAPASATLAVSIVAAPATASVSADESTVTAGTQSTVTLTVQPYPVAVTATATLTFTPAAANGPQDPAVLFANNKTTDSLTINPGTAASSNQFQFQAGSTAGTVTVTIHLTLADGTDITPSNLQPVTVTVPTAAPVISTATLTRSNQTLQVAVIALSSTRDMTQAQFHFTPVSGKTLTTTDITVDLTSVFQAWYTSTASDQFGTNFTYTQPFTLNGNASDIQSVSVTLVNSAGTSEPATAQ